MSDYSQRPRRQLLRSYVARQNREESLNFWTTFEHEELFRVFCDLKSNPRCAGFDGFSFADISRPEGAEICRRLATQIFDGTYIPGPTLNFEKRKLSGGTRTLQIPEIIDHLVARTAHEAISPFAERLFCNQSYGYRPNRTAWHLLAKVVRHLQISHRSFFAAYDISAAFDQVHLDAILEGFERLFGDVHCAYGDTRWPRLLKLILGGAVVREQGIGQGNPLSPLALNVALHYAADVRLVDARLAGWWRFADNFFLSAKSDFRLSERIHHLSNWLEHLGVSLHGCNGDFRDKFVPSLLGFDLEMRDEGYRFAISLSAWHKLETDLAQVHSHVDAPQALEDQLVGWIAAQGPALSCPAAAIKQMLAIAQRVTGLAPVGDKLQRQALSARRKWERLLRRVLNRR